MSKYFAVIVKLRSQQFLSVDHSNHTAQIKTKMLLN